MSNVIFEFIPERHFSLFVFSCSCSCSCSFKKRNFLAMDNIDWYSLLTLQESDNMQLDLDSNLFETNNNSSSLCFDFLNNQFSDINIPNFAQMPPSFSNTGIFPNSGLLTSDPLDIPNSDLFDISSDSGLLEIDDISEPDNMDLLVSSSNSVNNYQYNLTVGDCFDDWSSVDRFMHQYCFERGFGYQIFRSDKDPNDPNIIRRKSFRCSSGNTYKPRKEIDHTLHRLRGTMKSDCKWHCNFTFPKSTQQIKCTTLEDEHNHEINPNQVSHIISRYRRLSEGMIQDLKFFLKCQVAPITQLEILKNKYPEHVFHKQDVYNAIYKLRQNNNSGSSDTTLLLDVLFEKISQDPRWKVFIRHAGKERRLSGIFWMSPSQQELYQRFSDVVLNDNTCKTNKYNMYLSVFLIRDNYGRFRNVANALVEDELASTYIWILQCLTKATDNTIPKSIWTDSEPGLINAISQVFPNTPHFYCLFHIWQNIIKHLKSKISDFNEFGKAFYSCRNTLSISIFEQRWEDMIKRFPECQNYMDRTLYSNRISWARAYLPTQFNACVQSTQSVESFNGIIKRSLNSASTLCDVEEAINKRQDEEIKYCQLTNIKAKYTTIGLPHMSSQFFSDIDMILVEFLSPLILSWQRFQISQSFTYEGQLVSSLPEVCISF